MPVHRVPKSASERGERCEEGCRRCATLPAEVPRTPHAECEVTDLRARAPVLSNDAVDLTSSHKQPVQATRQRAWSLSVEAEQPRDEGEAVARRGETKPELPVLADPKPLVVASDGE